MCIRDSSSSALTTRVTAGTFRNSSRAPPPSSALTRPVSLLYNAPPLIVNRRLSLFFAYVGSS
eukprot:8079811-Pyramimonas_sp.AAC.1